jgi:hypothetical protein
MRGHFAQLQAGTATIGPEQAFAQRRQADVVGSCAVLAREVRALCVDVGALPETGDGGGALSRAALHARFLGMSEIAFSQLGEEFSVESEAEHECFWQAEAD